MDSNNILEYQVDKITNQCSNILIQISQIEDRIAYIENVLSTLLIALVNGGVIKPDDNGDHKF